MKTVSTTQVPLQAEASSTSLLPGSKIVSLLFALVLAFTPRAGAAPVKVVLQQPVSTVKLPNGDLLLDFGRVAFGNLQLNAKLRSNAPISVRFGEAFRDGAIDRHPPGTVRYAEVTVSLAGHTQIVAPPPDKRNTAPPAVPTQADLGVLLPFRWVEISNWPGELPPNAVLRRAVFDSTWNDQAATFHSSNPTLDRVWDLCHYSIKATTFAGIFVDGDRERIAYEADAYLNQLSYYSGNGSSQIERDTFERLMRYPTWPSEWAPHMIFIAYADWLQTGDKEWLAQHYEWLKTKLLLDRVGADGLVQSNPAQMHHDDIVDWPAGERDGFVFTPENTVVNAFYLHAVNNMRLLALALGKLQDAQNMAERYKQGLASFQRLFFDQNTGLYRDGIGTGHSSLHANLFPLAFDLVPEEKRANVAEWLAAKGMRGSPYAAQYLLEALFENNQTQAALDEITAPNDRSWKHMVDSGTTITWEAWDGNYKPNQDWTHAWGAAPANLLPRFVLGIRAAKPGWSQADIAPHPGNLLFASGKMPTPKGTIQIAWTRKHRFTLSLQLPQNMQANVRLPATPGSHGVWQGNRSVPAHRDGEWWVLDNHVQGNVSLQVR